MQEQLNTTKDYFDRFIQHIIDGLPKFLGALLILLIGYLIAKAVAAGVRKLLQGAHLNEHIHAGHGGNIIQRAVPDPSGMIAKLAYWIVFLFSLSIAITALGIPGLVDMIRSIYGYLPNVIAAILIFLVAGAVSAGVITLVTNTMGDTPTGKIVASAGPVVVMSLAVFMILNQLKIAPAIVTITYGAIVGSAALGMALAFGLGGREVAARMLEGLYQKGQENKDAIKNDFRSGARNARQKAGNVRGKMR
jgi:hypothetical protein